MKELYFIELLGNIHYALLTLIIIAAVMVLIFGAVYIAEIGDYGDDTRAETAKKWFNKSLLAFVLVLLLSVFIPSRNAMFMIYGIGSTIDYIKSNDTAKQLPDKAIQALDKWLEGQKEE